MKIKFILLASMGIFLNCKKDNQNNSKIINEKQQIERAVEVNKEENNNDMINSSTQNEIKFTDLFNEGSIIEFSPDDLKKSDDKEILEFKNKLEKYYEDNPLLEDFNPEDLKLLINNNVLENKDYSHINSKWLDYFIKKHNLKNYLTAIMKEAIDNEDYEAIKVILDNEYIVSRLDYEFTKEKFNEIKLIINEKNDEDFYAYQNSKIDIILKLIKTKYMNNKIFDKDGYSNLREAKNPSSKIIGKINSGELIDVLSNENDDVIESDKGWFLVQNKEGKKGYIHKSRIVSE